MYYSQREDLLYPQLIQEIEEPVDHLEGAQSHHEDVLEPQNID